MSPEAAAWFRQALVDVAGVREALYPRWSGVGRRLGRATLAVTAAEEGRLLTAKAPFVPLGWGVDEIGRALLLLTGLPIVPVAEQEAAVEELYRTGETRERQAVLRVLAYLPGPERFTALAVDAVRANVLSELEAIACENPFPQRHFPEAAFNQLVMKCLFNGIGLARIQGLAARRTPELVRMVAGLASERRAAGRPVPDDVTLVLDGGA